jgi:GNAT superfamily N-acetyltransferase
LPGRSADPLTHDVKHLLDNVIWHSLSGHHGKFSLGGDEARRYAPGFTPMAAFADNVRPNFAALARLCNPGDSVHVMGDAMPLPPDWRLEFEAPLVKMLWDAPMPATDEAPEAVRLGPEHAARALELALLTRPGPFGLRSVEMGEFHGLFEGDRLIAMAGERLHAGPWHEVSGVCTHPDFQGRGHARRLMAKVIRRQMQRNEQPILHVMSANTGARGFYERLGFRNYHESVIRVITPC